MVIGTCTDIMDPILGCVTLDQFMSFFNRNGSLDRLIQRDREFSRGKLFRIFAALGYLIFIHGFEIAPPTIHVSNITIYNNLRPELKAYLKKNLLFWAQFGAIVYENRQVPILLSNAIRDLQRSHYPVFSTD